MDGLKVSIIIPVYNEADILSVCLEKLCKLILPYEKEIIVVDHDSSDESVHIAKSYGAIVVSKKGGTISSVRNLGVERSTGDVLVFIDADVVVSENWGLEFVRIVTLLSRNDNMIYGAHCRPPRDSSALERYWFSELSNEKRTKHIGSGHMIITKRFYDELGGFDEKMVTGEDYDICRRAVGLGGEVVNIPTLVAYHYGYPKNIFGFMKREMWHGVGDVKSISLFIKSKVAVLSVFVLFLLSADLLLLVNNKLDLFLYVAILLLFMLLISSVYKFRDSGVKVIIINSYLFLFYYLGRSFSLPFLLFRCLRGKHGG